MTALLRDSAYGEGEALLKLLEEQADILQAIDYTVDHAPIDLPFLQGLNQLVERAPLGRWHQEVLERVLTRVDPASQAWLNAVILLQQGKRAIALGQLDDARQAFEDSLEIDRRLHNERGEAMVLNSLGGVLRDLGHMDEARQSFEDSLQICRRLHNERTEAMALNSLGGVLRDLGHMDEARQSFEDSLEICRRLHDERTEAMVLNNLGWWFREQGNPEQALKALEEHRAIQKALMLPIPKFVSDELKKLRQWLKRLSGGTGQLAEYHLVMAKKRSKANDWPGAIIHLRHNLALANAATDRGERLAFLAHAYFRAQRRAEAITVAKEALASGVVNATLYADLGRALHLEGGCLGESEKFLRHSLDLNPDNPWAWSWLGLVLADQGSLEDAEHHARRALVGHGQHAVLIQNLALVLVHHSTNAPISSRKH